MQKPEECNECPLGRKFPNKEGELITLGQSFTKSYGKAKFGVYLVGESAGNHEAQEGYPFVKNGESGSLINSIIEKLDVFDPEIQKNRKMKREDFCWDNVVKCRPPNDELVGKYYERQAIECCSGYNARSFGMDGGSFDSSTYNKVILALGGTAFKFLTGIEGKKLGIEDIRGYVFRSDNYRSLIIPALHPSFIRHGNSRFTNSLIFDVKKALAVANGSFRNYRDHPSFNLPSFVVAGKLEALVSFFYRCKENSQLTIYYDIENPYTKTVDEDEKGDEEEDGTNGKESSNEITSIQFATDTKWAIMVPWEKPYIKVALAILALGNDKVGANVWHHDNPRLEFNGAVINGTVHDLMWAWHHLQSGLWKRLQSIGSFFGVPYNWKHLALTGNDSDDNVYGCMDVIAPAYIWPKLIVQMKQAGVWDSYIRFKLEYRVKVLRPAELRGMPVDLKEHQEFKGWVEGEVLKEDVCLQNGIPTDLRNIKPRRKTRGTTEISFGYIREPKAIQELRGGYNETRARMLYQGIQPEAIISFEKWAERKSGLVYREFDGDGISSNQDNLFLEGDGKVGRWCKVEPFKASSQQLIKYLKYRIAENPDEGYCVPKQLKGGRETTGKKELQEVWEKTNDELLGSVIRIRSYSKMLSNDIPNWLPNKDGVVRTTFKFDPPSWQLNSSSPNIQNASKHPKEWELIGKTASELVLIGQRFRRIVKAPPGRCVVEFDKTAFHVSLMGFEARDPLYIKWAPYMHTVFASYIVGEPIPLEGEIDHDKLKYIKKKFKVVRDSQAKPAVLGNQLGLGHVKLHYQNRSFIDGEGMRCVGIESRRRAKYLQDMLASLFPKVELYKKRIKEEAHFKKHLRSAYGALRWFYDVLRYDYKSRMMKNGSEAEEAQSHNLQSNAFGMIHSEAIDMGDNSDILEEHWFANTIHDSFVFFPEIGKRDRCIEEVWGYMNKPEKILSDPICAPNGLVVGVEVMASPEGGNWASYRKGWNEMGIQEVKI